MQTSKTLSSTVMIWSSTHMLILVFCVFHKRPQEKIYKSVKSILHDGAFSRLLFEANAHSSELLLRSFIMLTSISPIFIRHVLLKSNWSYSRTWTPIPSVTLSILASCPSFIISLFATCNFHHKALNFYVSFHPVLVFFPKLLIMSFHVIVTVYANNLSKPPYIQLTVFLSH